nr:hypothetical protein [Planctomycetota bacterium]
MSPRDDAKLRKRCRRLLGDAWGADVRVTRIDILKDWNRNLVARLHLDGGQAGTVIAKLILTQPACGFSDWAALCFLSELSESSELSEASPRVAPRFIAGDVQEQLFVMEDVAGTGFDVLLMDGDRAQVGAALDRIGAATARLHAATAGGDRERAYG